jgi:three-Cys-motif partner protein
MAELKPRNTQTKVKHEILSRYLDRWGGIIVGGLSSASKHRDWHFVYVDCFSFSGKYAGEKEDSFQNTEKKTIYGSPIIGINALDRLSSHAEKKMGVNIRVNTILVEEHKGTYKGLKETVQEAGFSHRIKETRDFQSLSNGQIALVNNDAISIADELLLYTSQPNTWAFYLIDPYGPSGIPYDFVRKIVSREHHDVMINFIYEDLLRKTGMCLRENLTGPQKQLLEHWSNAFGGDWWIDLAKETLTNEESTRNFREALDGIPLSDMEGIPFTDEELSQVKEQKFVSAYRDTLHSMDKSLVTKLVNLRFGDKERTMFYLFLTTHDATGALALNRILSDAKYLEHELRIRLKNAKKPIRSVPDAEQLTLWSIESESIESKKTAESEIDPRPTNQEIGKVIMEKFGGEKATKKGIYRELANTLYFPEEIDKALRFLRRIELAAFDGDLRHTTVITFSANE